MTKKIHTPDEDFRYACDRKYVFRSFEDRRATTNTSGVADDRRKGLLRRKCDRERQAWDNRETVPQDHEHASGTETALSFYSQSEKDLYEYLDISILPDIYQMLDTYIEKWMHEYRCNNTVSAISESIDDLASILKIVPLLRRRFELEDGGEFGGQKDTSTIARKNSRLRSFLTSKICRHVLGDGTLPPEIKWVFMSIAVRRLHSGVHPNSEIEENVGSGIREDREGAEDLKTILTPRELLFFRENCHPD